MRPLHKAFLSIAAIACVVAGVVLPRHSPPVRVAATPHPPTSVSAASGYSSTVVWPDVSALVARLGAEETISVIGAELARVQSFVESIPIPAAVPERARAAVLPEPQTAGGGGITQGGHSDLWWSGVASCEQGGNNHPYYGYFSFMDGSQGGKPWDEQVAAANELIARYPGAWAQACVDAGYRASPNG